MEGNLEGIMSREVWQKSEREIESEYTVSERKLGYPVKKWSQMNIAGIQFPGNWGTEMSTDEHKPNTEWSLWPSASNPAYKSHEGQNSLCLQGEAEPRSWG